MSTSDFIDFQLPKYHRLNVEELTKIWLEMKDEPAKDAKAIKPFSEKPKKTFIVQTIEEEEKSVFSDRSMLGGNQINVDVPSKLDKSLINKSTISVKNEAVNHNISSLDISKTSTAKPSQTKKDLMIRLEMNKENETHENSQLRSKISMLKENLEEQLSSRESPKKVAAAENKPNLKRKTHEIKKKIEELISKKKNTSFSGKALPEAKQPSSREEEYEELEDLKRDIKIIENDFGSCESKKFIQNSPTFFSPRDFFARQAEVCQSFADPLLGRPKSFEETGFNIKDSWQMIRDSVNPLQKTSETPKIAADLPKPEKTQEVALAPQESPKKRSTFLPSKSEEQSKNVSKLSAIQKITISTNDSALALSTRRKNHSEDHSSVLSVSPLLQNFSKKGILSPKPSNKIMLEQMFNDIAQFQRGSEDSKKLSSDHVKNIVKLVVIIEKKISDQLKLIFLYYRGLGRDSVRTSKMHNALTVCSDETSLDTQRESMRKMEEKLRRMEEILCAKRQNERAQSDRNVIDKLASEYSSVGNTIGRNNFTDRPTRPNQHSNIFMTENDFEYDKKQSNYFSAGAENAGLKKTITVSENQSLIVHTNESKCFASERNLFLEGRDRNHSGVILREDVFSEEALKSMEAENEQRNMELLERVFNISKREVRFVKKACFKKWYKKISKQREMIVKGIRICESLMFMFKVYMKSHFFILKQNTKSKHFRNIKRSSLLKMLLMNKIHCLDNYKRIYFTKFRALCSIADRDCSRMGTPVKLPTKSSRTETLKSAGLLALNAFAACSREVRKDALKQFYINLLLSKTLKNNRKQRRGKAVRALLLRNLRDEKRRILLKWRKATVQVERPLGLKSRCPKENNGSLLTALDIGQLIGSLLRKRLDLAFKYLQVNMLNQRNKVESLKNLVLKADFLLEKKSLENLLFFFDCLRESNSLSRTREDLVLRASYLIEKMDLRIAFGNLKRETEMVRIADTVNKYTYFCIRSAMQSLSIVNVISLKSAFENIAKFSLMSRAAEQQEQKQNISSTEKIKQEVVLRRSNFSLASSTLEWTLRMLLRANKNKIFQILKAEAHKSSRSCETVTATANRLEAFLSRKCEKQMQGVYNILKLQGTKLITSNRLYQSYVIKVLAMKKLKFFFEGRAIGLREAYNRWNAKRFVMKMFMEKRKLKTLGKLFNGFIRAGAPRNKEMLKDYILERFVIRFERLLVRKALNAGFVRILGYKMKKLAVALHYYTPKSKKTKTGTKKGKAANDEEVIKNIIVSPTNSSPKMISTLCKTPSNNNKSQFYVNQSASLNHNLSTNLNNASLQSLGSTYMRKYF